MIRSPGCVHVGGSRTTQSKLPMLVGERRAIHSHFEVGRQKRISALRHILPKDALPIGDVRFLAFRRHIKLQDVSEHHIIRPCPALKMSWFVGIPLMICPSFSGWCSSIGILPGTAPVYKHRISAYVRPVDFLARRVLSKQRGSIPPWMTRES